MTIFFTADHHFGHHNGIEQNRRPFPSVTEMNTAMIERWNSVVQPEDEVWHLGDFAYKSARPVEGIFSELNGHKHLILGNHDAPKTRALAWASVSQMKEVLVDGQRMFLCHYPMMSWPAMNRGAIHLHGHVHGNTQGPAGSIDVGVDCWGFRPVSLPEILERLDQRLRVPAYEHQMGAAATLTEANRTQMRRYAPRLVELETEEGWATHDLIRTGLDVVAHVTPKARRSLQTICETMNDHDRELAFRMISAHVDFVLERMKAEPKPLPGMPAPLTKNQREQMRTYSARLVELQEIENWDSFAMIRTAMDTIAHVDAETRRDLEFICEYGVAWERELAFQKIGDAVKAVLEDIIEQRILQPGKNPDGN
jgi:calcineurin-like phosphoesterase family protein